MLFPPVVERGIDGVGVGASQAAKRRGPALEQALLPCIAQAQPALPSRGCVWLLQCSTS